MKYLSELNAEEVKQVVDAYKGHEFPPYHFFTYEIVDGNVTRKLVDDVLLELPILIPSDMRLDKIIEYDGPGQVIGVWWEMAGDEVAVTDGYMTQVGGNPWWSLLNFIEKFGLKWWITIGASDCEAVHALVYDRIWNNWYYAKKEDAIKIITGQWMVAGFPTSDVRLTNEMKVVIDRFLARI